MGVSKPTEMAIRDLLQEELRKRGMVESLCLSKLEKELCMNTLRAFSKYGCTYITQVGVEGKEPDLIIEFDGSKVVGR